MISFFFGYSEFDLLVGCHFPNITPFDQFTISKSYYQDDLTWCVQKSTYFPLFMNVWLGTSIPMWIGMFTGFVIVVFIFYLLIQFDVEYKQRNQHDINYAIMFILVPIFIGMNARFQPKLSSIRLIYGLLLLVMVSFWQIIFFLDVRFIKIPIQRHQISSIREIVQEDFHLIGSPELRQLISFDERVIIYMSGCKSMSMETSFHSIESDVFRTFFSTKNRKSILYPFARASNDVWIF